MKYAICNETFRDWPHEKAFAFAAECGYTGIEIAPFTLAQSAYDVSPDERTRIARLAEANGLEIIGLHWLLAKTEGLHLTSPDADVRSNTADYLIELGMLCADLGGKLLVLGSPQQRSLPEGVTREQGLAYAADVLCTILPVLEAQGVSLAIEPLSPKDTNFICTAAEAGELIDRVGSSMIQLHLDCKAMASESIPIADLIRKNGDILRHFHANDPNDQGPGFGELDFGPIFQALKEIRYDGWVSVEVFDFAPGVERLARESIEYLKRHAV